MSTVYLQATEERVLNWVRWLRDDSGQRHRCASAEGMYVAPAADDGKHDYMRQGVIDVLDAERVERAVIELPVAGRLFMKMFYVDRMPKRVVMRKFKMSEESVDSFRLRNLADVERIAPLDQGACLIRRGKPIWAGACQLKKAGV